MAIVVMEQGVYERRDGKIVAWEADERNSAGRVLQHKVGAGFYTPNGKSGFSTLDLIREIVVGEGWRPWNGGENPAPRKRVDVAFRSAGAQCSGESEVWRWGWVGSASDILAYRVVEQAADPAPVVPARNPTERIDELLRANNDLLERARKAEADRDAAGKNSLLMMECAQLLAEKRDGENRRANEAEAQSKFFSDLLKAAPSSGFRVEPGYEAFAGVLQMALDQTQLGKGQIRHANGKRFDEQPIIEIGRRRGVGFNLGQADKKTDEAQHMLARNERRAAVAEILGAINYLAAAVMLIGEASDE